jgi:hypothetical protein
MYSNLSIAKSIKIIDGFSIYIFSRKHSGSHDNKYVKIIKNGTVFAKYVFGKRKWESLSKDVPKNVIDWVHGNESYILNEINKLDAQG